LDTLGRWPPCVRRISISRARGTATVENHSLVEARQVTFARCYPSVLQGQLQARCDGCRKPGSTAAPQTARVFQQMIQGPRLSKMCGEFLSYTPLAPEPGFQHNFPRLPVRPGYQARARSGFVSLKRTTGEKVERLCRRPHVSKMRQMMRGAHGPFGRAAVGRGALVRKRSSCHLARMSLEEGHAYTCTL